MESSLYKQVYYTSGAQLLQTAHSASLRISIALDETLVQLAAFPASTGYDKSTWGGEKKYELVKLVVGLLVHEETLCKITSK